MLRFRFLRLESEETLARPKVEALFAAIAQARTLSC